MIARFLTWLRNLFTPPDVSHAWRRDQLRREAAQGVELAPINWDAMKRRDL